MFLADSISVSTTEVVAAITCLGGAIGVLWMSLQKTIAGKIEHTEKLYAETAKKLDQCEVKHDEVSLKMVQMSSEIGELRGRQAGVTELAKQVLEVVARGK